MMSVRVDSHSVQLIDQMLAFGGAVCNARWSSFVWINADLEIESMQGGGIPAGLASYYHDTIHGLDPLSPRQLLQLGGAVGMLRGYEADLAGSASPEYRVYINKFDIGDEADLLFWSKGVPIAGLALYRSRVDQRFATDHRDWEAMRRYFENSLASHAIVRQHSIRSTLKQRYGLNPREIEVVETLNEGATNAEIAETLVISISTVKCHVVNIMNKFGVDNRASVQAVVNDLPYQ